MKKSMLASLLLFAFSLVQGQSANDCTLETLKKETNIKNAETCVLMTADFVLSQPLQSNGQKYSEYKSYILVWMEKTPDFTFTLNENMMATCNVKDNPLLFGVYTTCLAKAALEHKKDFYPKAIELFVNYVRKSENKVKITPKIKKLIQAYEENKLEKYIN